LSGSCILLLPAHNYCKFAASIVDSLTSYYKRASIVGYAGAVLVTMGFVPATVLGALLLISAAKSAPSLHNQGIVQKFETVHPQVLHKTRPTRNAHSDRLDVKITSESGESFTLRLTLNDMVISPAFSSMYYAEDGHLVKVEDQVNCFYQGEVLEHPEWQVAMDSCQGLRGSFGDWSNKTRHFIVEPLSEEDYSLEQPHSMYLAAHASDEGGTCATEGHSHSEEEDAAFNPLGLDEEIVERARRQTSPHYVEIHVVSDNAQYRHYRTLERTVNRAISLLNVADTIYRALNIRVVGLRAETWSDSDHYGTFSPSPDVTLQQLRNYARGVHQRFDAFFLLTGNDFDGSTIGIAYLRTMCGGASVGIVQDKHIPAQSTGSTFAHEIGHLFGMSHDSGSCSCPEQRCVMSAVINTANPPQSWSSCSINTMNSRIGGYAHCITNTPEDILGDPVCGDGIVQGDEVCDCGTPQVGAGTAHAHIRAAMGTRSICSRS
jgi:hypothetical protein